jgi:hypothetical protein
MDMDLCQPTTTACYVPKLKMDGNKWLDKVFVNTRKATKDEVIAAFNTQNWSTWKIFIYWSLLLVKTSAVGD